VPDADAAIRGIRERMWLLMAGIALVAVRMGMARVRTEIVEGIRPEVPPGRWVAIAAILGLSSRSAAADVARLTPRSRRVIYRSIRMT
jgi:hypothetical protein